MIPKMPNGKTLFPLQKAWWAKYGDRWVTARQVLSDAALPQNYPLLSAVMDFCPLFNQHDARGFAAALSRAKGWDVYGSGARIQRRGPAAARGEWRVDRNPDVLARSTSVRSASVHDLIPIPRRRDGGLTADDLACIAAALARITATLTERAAP